MNFIYLDTSPLMRLAESDVPHPGTRNTAIAQIVQSFIADTDTTVAASSHTILEYYNNLATNWRKNGHPEYDESWFERSRYNVMKYIHDMQITVVPMPRKASEQVMSLITFASRRGNALRAWDAMHLQAAASWAEELGCKVDLATTDTDFDKFVTVFPELRDYVNPRNLDNE